MKTKIIAIVDDDPEAISTIKEYFSVRGFIVKGYNEPEAFLNSLDKLLPDILILDVVFEHRSIDGFDICKRIKGTSKLAGIPIIVVSAKTTEDDKVKGLNLGADDYIVKPFSLKELECRVTSIVKREQQLKKQTKIKKHNSIALENKMKELDILTKSVVNREIRIIELKKEINKLLEELGKPSEYAV